MLMVIKYNANITRVEHKETVSHGYSLDSARIFEYKHEFPNIKRRETLSKMSF